MDLLLISHNQVQATCPSSQDTDGIQFEQCPNLCYVQLWMVRTRELNMSMMLFDSVLNEMSGLSSVNCLVLSSKVVNAL